MSPRDHEPVGPRNPGYVCPVCGRTFDRDRRYCSRCGSNLVVRRDDAQVYDRILRMCGIPCSPPSGAKQ